MGEYAKGVGGREGAGEDTVEQGKELEKMQEEHAAQEAQEVQDVQDVHQVHKVHDPASAKLQNVGSA